MLSSVYNLVIKLHDHGKDINCFYIVVLHGTATQFSSGSYVSTVRR